MAVEVPPSALIPFDCTSGSRIAKIILVGEAFGEKEELTGFPFVGWAGQELFRMLDEAGISRRDVLSTNVFPFRPGKDKNDIYQLCGPKSEVGKDYPLKPLSMGKYVLNEYLPCLDRLKAEIETVRPNLVIALGSTACWALLGTPGISRLRGVVAWSTLCPGVKVLPTYHPSAVLRMWQHRPVVVADLIKAKREAQTPHIIRKSRKLLVSPTLHQLYEWWSAATWRTKLLSVDIETRDRQITMIGFAESADMAVVVPFVSPRSEWPHAVSYWGTLQEELMAWCLVRTILESPIPKLFQNGMYDLQYLARMGFRPRACLEDTMLKHHSFYPELPKSLGFLGSIYANEAAWKELRSVKDEEKKDA